MWGCFTPPFYWPKAWWGPDVVQMRSTFDVVTWEELLTPGAPSNFHKFCSDCFADIKVHVPPLVQCFNFIKIDLIEILSNPLFYIYDEISSKSLWFLIVVRIYVLYMHMLNNVLYQMTDFALCCLSSKINLCMMDVICLFRSLSVNKYIMKHLNRTSYSLIFIICAIW